MEDWTVDYCILEMVTTGPDPETALPLEAAAVRVLHGAEAEHFQVFIDTGVTVPACVLEKSGRCEEGHRRGEGLQEAMRRLLDFLGPRHVISHEGKAVEACMLERFRALPPGPVLDTRELAWMVAPYLRDHSFPALAFSLAGEEPSRKALEDARLLLRLLELLRGAWEEAPRRLREAVACALDEAGSPWRLFLPARRSRLSFPDLTQMVPHTEEALRRAAGDRWPEAPARPQRGSMVPEEAAAILAPGGPLAPLLPGHEPRPQQAAMAAAVAEAMSEASFLVVEAGTGVGKSLAYLVPGVLYARTGSGPVVVSTYTRNLQEQLFHNDLPLLSRALGRVEFALLKGRGNYLCLRKWAEWCASLHRREPALYLAGLAPSESYAYLASWLLRTASGDLEEISLELRLLLCELTRELASSAEDCLRSDCPHSARCFVEKARALAASSEVVVVNHALLLSQLTDVDTGPSNLVLPEYGALVLDEAHHLEDVATDAFSLAFSLEGCLRTLEDLSGGGGLAAGWGPLQPDGEDRATLCEVHELAERSRSLAGEMCLRNIAPLLPEAVEGTGGEWTRLRLERGMLSHPAWENARETGLDLAASLSGLASRLSGLAEKAPAGVGGRDAALRAARRAEALSQRARDASRALDVFFREPGREEFQRHLRWIERGPARGGSASPVHISLISAPVNVGSDLSSALFAPLQSCVLTSASLRVAGARGGFAFFLRQTGLDEVEEGGRELRLLALDSPFDYTRQVRLIAVVDLPEPKAAGEAFSRYMHGVSRVVEDALLAAGGKSLVLLTSHQQVDFLYRELRPRLEEHGLCCLRQRRGMPNALLLERFRADRDSVLLATEAFWEGVDVPGESLSVVILVKLPFRHPQDPVVAGRVEHHDREGAGGWYSYYLPLAVTLFRQGIGRLVRRSTDQGVIVVMDPRFLNRSYSRLFHAALPDGLRVETVRRDEFGDTIRACFRGH